jgi:hypothetical protein
LGNADPADYFGFDLCLMYIDASPRFDMKVLARAGGNITYEDRFGYTISKPEGISSTMHFLSHQTADRDAWEHLTKPGLQLVPEDFARIDDRMYFGHFDPYPTWDGALGKYKRLYATNRYMLFMFYGPWEATWRHRGMEALLMDVALETEWTRVWMHSDGAIVPLIDDLIERGVQVLNPLEVKAGMDVIELRKHYGRKLAFFGNVDARKIYGPLDELEAELHRKVPLARDGGYILHSDHSCPPEVTLDRYEWMLGTARDIFHQR